MSEEWITHGYKELGLKKITGRRERLKKNTDQEQSPGANGWLKWWKMGKEEAFRRKLSNNNYETGLQYLIFMYACM